MFKIITIKKTTVRRQISSFWYFYFIIITLKIFHTFSVVSIVDFEQVNVSWDHIKCFLVLAEKSFLTFRVAF